MKETRNSKTEQTSQPSDAVVEPGTETPNTSVPGGTDQTQPSQEKAEPTAPSTTDTQPPEPPHTAKKPPEKNGPGNSPEKEPRSGATWPGKLALLLSVITLGGGGYLVWEGWQLKQQNSQLQERLSQQLETSLANGRAEVAQTVTSVSQQLGQLQARSEADKKNIDELQNRLTLSIQQVSANRELSRKDWLLAEVEYLLRLANQRVLMEQTASGALTLLKSADKALSETDDVTVYDVRGALAADIAALEAVPKLDSEGIFLRLGALNRQVNNLRVVPVSERRELPEMLEEITPESVKASWGEGLKASWNTAMDKFENLIVIQHHDEPVKPLMSPEQTFFLQQNLHLMLEQAQMALLQRKQQAYDSSLTKAQEWVGTHFDPKDATTEALLGGLSELRNVNVAPKLPDISGSLASLKAYLSRMQRLREEGENR